MKKFLVLISTFLIGLLAFSFLAKSGHEDVAFRTSSVSNRFYKPTFRYMGGNTFLSPSGNFQYANDCIGCGPMGDISVYHNTEHRPDLTEYTLQANCGTAANGNVLERTDKLDEAGRIIGARCMAIVGGEARIFWTEGTD